MDNSTQSSRFRIPMLPPDFDPRLAVALTTSKLAGKAIRRLGRGGGTSAPGLLAERIDPNILNKLAARLESGAIVVAGTNGKTTTSRMVADILSAAGYEVVHNRTGANLVRGVTSALADRTSPLGAPKGTIAVIEADEAAFPEIVRRTQPRLILLNNLFRDQLDRYGELDTIARTWRPALQALPATSTVVVNADDPTLAAITSGLTAARITFGLNEKRHILNELPHAADAATCKVCGADLRYHALFVSHLGDWYCPNGDSQRPPLDVAGGQIELKGVEALAMTVTPTNNTPVNLTIEVPGIYNAYNTVAAYTVTAQAGVAPETIKATLATFKAPFGRIERVQYRGRNLTLALVKNPVGFNEVLRMLTAGQAGLSVPTMIAINDLDADGRDVSWLWDVDFELLATGTGPLSTSGIRGNDMANRLKYAGVPETRITSLPDDLAAGLDAFVASVPEGSHAYILPTYTAMLNLRKILADRGAVEDFWDE